VAVISDAGTPLISDPGFALVRAAHQAGIQVSPIPGPSAAIAALSVSGLATDRFVFEGFLPRSPQQRRERLKSLRPERRTLIFYESSHRILGTLADLVDQFGALRRGVVARELTKLHETIIADDLAALQQRLRDDPDQQKGEFVLVVAGLEGAGEAAGAEAELRRVVRLLLDDDLPVKRVAALAARITGRGRNEAYRLALQLSSS
jgi:16S rRNA (cytidine1402-2'-O)-methyltransferase